MPVRVEQAHVPASLAPGSTIGTAAEANFEVTSAAGSGSRKANRAGPVEVAFNRDDVEKRLPVVTQIFDAAQAAQPMLHFLAGRYRPFTVEMFRNAADQSRLAVCPLSRDTPVATMFTLHNGVTMGAGGCRFDHTFGRFSPGQLLWRHAFEFAFSTSCTEIPFGPRDSFYKRQWSTSSYDTVEVSAFSSDAVHALQTGKAVVRTRPRLMEEGRRSSPPALDQ